MTISINGSGSLTGMSAGGLPDGTVLQADMGPNVAGNGPCFSAYKNAGSVGLSAGVAVKVALNTEQFDASNAFDSVTNYRFQPTVAGYYQLSGVIRVSGTAGVGANIGLGYIRLNGVDVYVVNGTSDSGGFSQMALNYLVYLNGTTDYVELWAGCTTAGAYYGTDAINTCRLQGYLARSA